jgi:phospholipase/lecithinase/hemolysin
LASKFYPKNMEEHFLDYAYGGANVGIKNHFNEFSLQNQIQKYLDEHAVVNPDALFVVWAGANNYLDLPEDIDSTVNQVILGLQTSIERLVENGATHLFVVNIPDLSTTPAAQEFDSQQELQEMSYKHNQKLKQMVGQLKQKYPTVRFVEYDITEIMGDIIAHPEEHGFKDGHHTCCEFIDNNTQSLGQYSEIQSSKLLTSVNQLAFASTKGHDVCDDYLFFDLYHPTAHAHWLMAEEIYKLFKQIGIDFD